MALEEALDEPLEEELEDELPLLLAAGSIGARPSTSKRTASFTQACMVRPVYTVVYVPRLTSRLLFHRLQDTGCAIRNCIRSKNTASTL